MSLKDDLFTALKALVSNRVYPDTFPQVSGVPYAPAIRYTLAGGTTWQDLCGDGEAETDDVRLQLDWIGRTADERETLTPLIRAAMKTLDPPCVMDGPVVTSFDSETKVYRAMAFWTSQGSSTT